MKPRILFVNHASELAGAEYCCLTIASSYRTTSKMLLFKDGPFREELENQGLVVSILDVPSSILNVRTYSVFKSFFAFLDLWKLAKQIAQVSKDFDLIYANSQKAFIACALATFFDTPPLIWHLRDILTAKHFSYLNRRVAICLANRCASHVFMASQATANAFIACGGNHHLVTVAYDGISSLPFDCIAASQVDLLRSSLGIDTETPLVGLFSRFSPWKGQHIFLEAIRQLPNNVHALLVGDVLFGEEKYADLIRFQLSDPNLTERVHWLGFRRDIPALMSACNIIVHASTEPEPCARIGIEGQLAGRPVIATNAGGMPEIIEDRINGRLVPPNDPSSMARVIQEILSDPEEAAKLSENALAISKHKFSPEVCISKVNEIIESILEKKEINP